MITTLDVAPRRRGARISAAAVALVLAVIGIGAAVAQTSPGQGIEIAVSLPLSGEGNEAFGQGTFEGIQLAIDEANARGGTHVELKVYDDKGTADGAKEVAAKIAASRAALVLGPSSSTSSLAAGPIYAQAGIASLCPTATSDAITDSATTFRLVFRNSQQGEALALYLARVLGGKRADVVVVDDKYGETLELGFRDAAQRLGVDARYHHFKTAEEAETIARQVGADSSTQAVVFLTLDPDAARMLNIMRLLGVEGPFLGDDALGSESFNDLLAGLPEAREKPGFFTDNVYGVSPLILDSANAETLAFAERFRARFHHDPAWMSVAGYDAARMAIAAAYGVASHGNANADTAQLRAAMLSYLASFNSVATALPGLLGPLWFDPNRGGQAPVRIGRFTGGRFGSAPLQIVPVSAPDAQEIASGAVFALGQRRFARLQRVVYSGVFMNEIPRIDVARSSFDADFYFWLRYARNAGPDSPDPTELIFPNMIGGSFDRTHPAEQGVMSDGTEYRLWRVRGEFRNDYDLRRFPFDRQTLSLTFTHARAAADRIVYVLDMRPVKDGAAGAVSVEGGGGAAAAPRPAPADRLSIASAAAFRNLTQWRPISATQRRDDLVTGSALGDLRRVGAESFRELSGFLVTIEVERRAIATLMKTLLPLLLMTLIMFASLYFPAALVKEKVAVAITGALSGAVLLTAINSQLGGIGYTVAVEYAFYLFFGLSLLCIVAVLAAERQRAAGQAATAVTIEQWTRTAFVIGVAIVVVGSVVMYWTSRR